MNLFHTLRRKAEFADIVFILMARCLCLTTQRNLTILQLERCCVCKRLAPYQISQEKMTARLGTLRRSFLFTAKPPCWYLAARRLCSYIDFTLQKHKSDSSLCTHYVR